MGGLLERAGEAQHIVRFLAGRYFDGNQARPANGQRSSLIEHCGPGAGKRLEWSAAFDENAVPRCLRDAGNERDWCSKDQWTGCCRDEYCEPTDSIARNV